MKTTIAKTEEAIGEYLGSLQNHELVVAHNQMCQNLNYPDNEIYANDDEFFTTFFDGRVLEAVRAISYGDYTYAHDWVRFNGYGNLDSTHYPMDWVDIFELTEDIMNNPEDYDIEFDEGNNEEEE